MKCSQFVGEPCGHHGPYVFYKEVKIFKHGKFKIIGLGEFFFVRISPSDDPCIGELQLLWEDKTSEQMLSSVRLYFLPEQTPEGRKSHHGEHEVVAASDRVILRVEDLRTWMTEEVSWCHGLVAPWSRHVVGAPQDGPLSAKAHALGPQHLETLKDTTESHLTETFLDKRYKDLDDVEQKDTCNEDGDVESKSSEKLSSRSACLLVLSYPRYCRYRGILKRLNGLQNEWLKNSLVVALGGFALPSKNGRVLFCRDTFEHEGLLHNELNCEHLAPTLKGKQRVKKKVKVQGRSQSPGSESNASEDSKDTSVKAQVSLYEANNGRKAVCKEEQEFLQKLFKFMQNRHTPIHRVPHLGFKQIDLFLFFSSAQKLGGYDAITCKKLWKHVYDEMGGNPGSTSAATCTRRHYERLLLPFERCSNGQNHLVESTSPPPTPAAESKAPEVPEPLLKREDSAESCKTEASDVKTEPAPEVEKIECPPPAAVRQDMDLKPLRPPITPILVDLEAETQPEPLNNQTRVRDTGISEKERKWNEIRRKTAIARNWARQARPFKPGTTDREQDLRVAHPSMHPAASDYSKSSPGNVYPVAFHPAFMNNKHSTMSGKPTKCPPSNMPPVSRERLSYSSHQPYLHHQPNHHNSIASRSQLAISSNSPESHMNGFPPSKECQYQRRPSVIQHTERVMSPPLPNQPMPAHLGNHTVEAAHLRTEGSKRPMFHPSYDSRIRPTDCVAETSTKNEFPSGSLTSRKGAVHAYTQLQHHRRQYYPSCKDKTQTDSRIRPVPDLASKREPSSSFPPAMAPSTPVYYGGSLRVQGGSPCEAEVLDLSVKSKKESSACFQNWLSDSLPEKKVSLNYNSEECLDLSVKKRKTAVVDMSDEARGIENVTPPSPISHSHSEENKITLMPPLKSPISTLSLLRCTAGDKVQLPQRDVNNINPPVFLPAVVDVKPNFLVENVQAAAQHSPGKPQFVSEYNPTLPQFVSPSPVFSSTTVPWPQTQQANLDNSQNNFSVGYKELVDHRAFSGPFSYSLSQRMLYKDGNAFPTFSK